jgi:hypothetical protein
MQIPRSLAALAQTQDGVLSRSQVVSLGITKQQLQRWVDRDLIERVGRRSLAYPGTPRTWRFLLRSALFDSGSAAVLSHRTAAHLHHFDGFEEGPIELTVPRENRARAISGVLHSTSRLLLIDRSKVDGVWPCTSPARTIIDLAQTCSREEVENAVDSALRLGACSSAFLGKRLDHLRHTGLHGVTMLDSILVDSGGANRLERRFLVLCRENGLPRPACQVVHRRTGQPVMRVDFDFAPFALIVEVEGNVAHSSPRQRQRDAERRRHLISLGRVVTSFTFEDVFHRPATVINDVRSHLQIRLRAS